MSDYIPEDNLVQILKNLPVKSLLRFRCVSKLWKDVIDSPSFLQDHLSVQNPRFLILKNDNPEPLVVDPHTLSTLPLGYNPKLYFFCGAHHGIVCLYGYRRDLFLWNPAIRKFSALPPLPYFNIRNYLPQSCLGFWIDPSNTEFKFIAFKLELEGIYDVDGLLYSSIRPDWRVIPRGEKGKWKPEMVGRVGDWGSRSRPGRPVMLASVAYWQGLYWGHEVMLSFDFVQERFEFVEMPFQKSLSVSSIPLQWQGTLSLLYYQLWNVTDSRRLELYSRQGDSWVYMFGFDVGFPIHVVYGVLGETEDNLKVLAETEGGLVLYDTHTRPGCIRYMGEYSTRNTTCVVARDYFVESLLLFPTSVITQ